MKYATLGVRESTCDHRKERHAQRIRVWVVISSHGLLWQIFIEETVNSERYLSILRSSFVPHLLATGVLLKTVVHAGWSQAAHSKCCFGLSA
jgi:hypothetical protein